MIYKEVIKITDKLKDIATESLTVGFLYKNAEMFDSYMEMIDSEKDFTDDNLRYMYEMLVTCRLSYTNINATTLNVLVSTQSDAQKSMFTKIGGSSAFERLGAVAESSGDFSKVFDKLKLYTTLRELNKLQITNNLNSFLKHDSTWALRQYDLAINKIGTKMARIELPDNLNKGIRDFVISVADEGDVGIDIPYPYLNNAFRGLRKGTLNCLALGSNKGKSRMLIDILSHISVCNQYRSTLISTEMSKEETQLMLAVNVANKLLSEKYNNTYIDESALTRSVLTANERQMIEEAVSIIEERCNIDFICCNIYSFDALKRLIKAQKLLGSDVIVIDVFKPYRSSDGEYQNQQEWQAFSKSAEMLKQLANELEISIVVTMQMTPESMVSGELEISSIALGKHIYFVLDTLLMGRHIESQKDFETIGYILDEPSNPFHEQVVPMERRKTNFEFRILKNRGGSAGESVIMEFDRGKILIKEKGLKRRLNISE